MHIYFSNQCAYSLVVLIIISYKYYQSTNIRLTGLALMILNAGITITVTTKNVRVSNPKSLMTSTALATSSDEYIRDLSQWAFLW